MMIVLVLLSSLEVKKHLLQVNSQMELFMDSLHLNSQSVGFADAVSVTETLCE
jgi:hypothetical protein